MIPRRSLGITAAFLALLPVFLMLAACGGGNNQPQVTLSMVHWLGAEDAPIITQINQKFHQLHPNITIQMQVLPGGTPYYANLNTRLQSGDVPDIIGMDSGTVKNSYVRSSYLADLTNQPWIAQLPSSAKASASYQGKVYQMPLEVSVSGVIYNKQIFADQHLTVPTTWDQFLAVCQQLKAAGIIPISYGQKDGWEANTLLSDFVPTGVYRDTPNFDQQLYNGQTTFATSAWQQVFTDIKGLQPYINTGVNGTPWQDLAQLFATNKAAMIVGADFFGANVLADNPNANMGMFPLPYQVQSGQTPGISTQIGFTWTIPAKTKHLAEAEEYLNFFSQATNSLPYYNVRHSIPTFAAIHPDLPSYIQDQIPFITKPTAYNLGSQELGPGFSTALDTGMQGLFAGTTTPAALAASLDTAYQSTKSQINPADLPQP